MNWFWHEFSALLKSMGPIVIPYLSLPNRDLRVQFGLLILQFIFILEPQKNKDQVNWTFIFTFLYDVLSVSLLVSSFGFVLACVSSGEGDGRLFQGQENDTNINTGQAMVPLGSTSAHTATGDVPDLWVLALGGYTHVRKHILSPWMATVQLPNVGVFGSDASFCVTER